jgi:hypothetical protein
MSQISQNKTTITEPRKLVIPDCSGNGNNITMVINWSKFIHNCEYIKLIMPNGDDCIVQKDEFRTLMMMIATQEEITEMGRQKVQTVRVIEKPVVIQAPRDIKKGEQIHFIDRIQLPVPIDVITSDGPVKEGFKGR